MISVQLFITATGHSYTTLLQCVPRVGEEFTFIAGPEREIHYLRVSRVNHYVETSSPSRLAGNHEIDIHVESLDQEEGR